MVSFYKYSYELTKVLEKKYGVNLKSKKDLDTVEKLLDYLERRLDVVVYKFNFATSIKQARQMISHGHVLVNDEKITISTFKVKDNDTITIRPEYWKHIVVENVEVSNNVEVDYTIFSGVFLTTPKITSTLREIVSAVLAR